MAKVKSYTQEKCDMWKEKVSEGDPLKDEKEEKLEFAIYLSYKVEILERILNATTEMQIYKAMVQGRESCA